MMSFTLLVLQFFPRRRLHNIKGTTELYRLEGCRTRNNTHTVEILFTLLLIVNGGRSGYATNIGPSRLIDPCGEMFGALRINVNARHHFASMRKLLIIEVFKMKKTLLAASVAAILAVPAASAYDLTINGGAVDGFEGASFSFSGDTLVLIAPGYTGPVDPGPVDPGPVDPGPVDPGPVDPGPVDPGPVDPGTDLCADLPSNVVCGYDISASDWASPAVEDARVTIKKNKILASKFQTSSNSDAYGEIGIWTPPGAAYSTLDLWVSNTPGGEPLADSRCVREYGKVQYELKWTQFDYSRRCSLEPSTVYFVNLKHSTPDSPTSTVVRDIITNTRN
jgi:hypothetical protein